MELMLAVAPQVQNRQTDVRRIMCKQTALYLVSVVSSV